MFMLVVNSNSNHVGEITLATIATATSSSLNATGFNFWLLNRNSQSSQYNNNATSFAIDTSVDFDLVITGQLANAADTLTLAALTLEAL